MIYLKPNVLAAVQDLQKELNTMLQYLDTDTTELSNKINAYLEDERDRYIAIEKTKGYTLSKNGFYERTLYSLDGKLNIKMPMVKGKKQIKSLLGKYQRTLEDFEKLIAYLLMQFTSWDSIINIIQNFTGIKIGHSIIQRINKELKEKYYDLFKKPIESKYKYVFIDACYYKVKMWMNILTGEISTDEIAEADRSKYVKKVITRAVFLAIGINEDGIKELISLKVQSSESKQSWFSFLDDLRSRGMVDPDCVVSDDFKGISDVIKNVFPTTRIQKCVIHRLRNACSFIPKDKLPDFKQAVRNIYSVNSKQEALAAFNYLRETYQSDYPKAIETIENVLDELLTFLDLPTEVRHLIYTNNFCENFFSALRRYIKKEDPFPSEWTFQSSLNICGLWISRKWKKRKLF